jgi:hypothetical protein
VLDWWIFGSPVGVVSTSSSCVEMKLLLINCLFCMSLPVLAGDFDGWYFKFLSVERKIAGETRSEHGKVVGAFTGTASGEISADGRSFTEKFEYLYMPEEHHVKEKLLWIKGEDGVFRATAELPDGNKFFCELTVKDENHYQLKTTFEDGRTCETNAELKEDGVLHAVDTAKDEEGNIIFTLKYTKT